MAIVLAVVVALLDTGVNVAHEHFVNKSITGDTVDICGHGTSMAGIILDIAPQTQLLSVDVASDECKAWSGILDREIRAAADSGANIIVVAWALRRSALQDAIDYAASKGAIVVTSDGLMTTTQYAPALNGYAWFSGNSAMAAFTAGQMARLTVRLPYVGKWQ